MMPLQTGIFSPKAYVWRETGFLVTLHALTVEACKETRFLSRPVSELKLYFEELKEFSGKRLDDFAAC